MTGRVQGKTVLISGAARGQGRSHAVRLAAEGLEVFGQVDCVLANAGIMPFFPPLGDTQQAYQDCVDVMPTGAYNTMRAVVPSMIEHGTGGSIVITSSIAGLKPRTDWEAGSLGYTVAKAGVIGLMRLTALRLGKHSIRCNTVHPTGVRTGMVDNEPFRQWVKDAHEYTSQMKNALPVEIMEPADISNLMVFLCSDESRYLTGETISVDAGYRLT